MREEIVAAILAHGQWKARLITAIETGKSDFTPDNVKVDDKCAFGKWFHSLSGEDLKSPYYNEVKELHAKFHQIAARILDLAITGKKEEAQTAMGPTSEYMEISTQLILTLGRWKNEAKD